MPFQKWMEDHYPEESVHTFDGFDEAIIGVTELWPNRDLVAVYSRQKCLQILIESGMSEDEAIEHFEFNVLGAYLGKQTPLIVDMWERPLVFEFKQPDPETLAYLKECFNQPLAVIEDKPAKSTLHLDYKMTFVDPDEAERDLNA